MEQSPDFCWGIIVKRKVQRVTEVVRKIVGPRVGERVDAGFKLEKLALGLEVGRKIGEGKLRENITSFLVNGREVQVKRAGKVIPRKERLIVVVFQGERRCRKRVGRS